MLLSQGNSTVNASDCNFVNNSADLGGAINAEVRIFVLHFVLMAIFSINLSEVDPQISW